MFSIWCCGAPKLHMPRFSLLGQGASTCFKKFFIWPSLVFVLFFFFVCIVHLHFSEVISKHIYKWMVTGLWLGRIQVVWLLPKLFSIFPLVHPQMYLCLIIFFLCLLSQFPGTVTPEMFRMMSNSEIIQHLTEQFNEVKEADWNHLAPLILISKHKAYCPFIYGSGK